jgi:hypothetical protein
MNYKPEPDVLWGVDAYVVELFGELPKAEHARRARQINHQLVNKQLPAQKVGRFWVGSKRALAQFLAAADPAAPAA